MRISSTDLSLFIEPNPSESTVVIVISAPISWDAGSVGSGAPGRGGIEDVETEGKRPELANVIPFSAALFIC
jgi:hypothetical protein